MPKKIKRHEWGGATLGKRWWVAYFGAYGLPAPELEHQFALPERGWRLDLAWPDWKIGVEINGGIWAGLPSHTGRGHVRDMEKINAAQARGWVIVQVLPSQVKSAELVLLVRQVLAHRTKEKT